MAALVFTVSIVENESRVNYRKLTEHVVTARRQSGKFW